MRSSVWSFVALVLATPVIAQDWTRIQLDTTADLYAVENTVLSKHWVVGAGGFGALSNDSRTEWTAIDTGTDANLFSVQEPIAFEVYMGAGGGVVRLRVYNGWFERNIPSSLDYRLFTRYGAKVVAVGPMGRIYRSLDAGNTWDSIPSGTLVNLNAGAGMPQGPAWIVGDEGTILRSSDGASWLPAPSGTTADLYGIAERDFIDLYVVGEAGTILKSTDAGASWTLLESGTSATLRAISISQESDHHLIAVGSGGTVLKSTDAGETWCHLEATSAELYSAEAVSDEEFLICGAGGLLLRTTNGGGACREPSGIDENPVVRLDLEGPFPQPATGLVSLLLHTERDDGISAEVFDLAGRIVRSTPQIERSSGEVTSFLWNTQDWAAGVYWMRIRVNGEQSVRHLVVAR